MAAPVAGRGHGPKIAALVGATESEIAAAFATIVEQRAGALLISSGAYSPAAIDQVLLLARRYAVPTLFFTRDPVVSGGLASYGTTAIARQMGVYTGRILKGENSIDLPVVSRSYWPSANRYSIPRLRPST